MVTKKIRTEYMKKFRDPKWETFSKCYEDSLKYRLTRRVMEHSHKPWFWEGWDSGSESSGWSTPRLSRNRVAPLSLPLPPPSEARQRLSSPGPKPPPGDEEAEVAGAGDAAGTGEAAGAGEAAGTGEAAGAGEAAVADAAPAAVVENGVNERSGGSATAVPNHTDGTETDDGPADTPSSDGEPVNPAPRRRHRRRTPRSEPGRRDGSHGDKPAVARKAPRAKSQPAIGAKENRRPSSRPDWTERQTESGATDGGAQTRRDSDKRGSNLDRRRARSADLEKTRRSRLTVADDRWVTEYMRCFSARLR